MPERRYLILAEGAFADAHRAKTAHGVLRYCDDDVVAIVDSQLAGRNLSDVLPELGKRARIVAHVRDALHLKPTSLLLGTATAGGGLPPIFRVEIEAAIDAGLEIVNGLHDMLRDDAEFVRRAAASGSRLWDVREVAEPIPIATGAAKNVPQIVVLAVGSDCAVGKMSVMLELRRAAADDGLNAAFVATGQTGIIIAGAGIAVDHVISDFVAGAAEQLVLSVPPSTDVTLVEGQGAIFHTAYAPVTFGLLFGSAPDLLVLCHKVGHDEIDDLGTPIPPLADLVRIHETILDFVKPARTVAIALNTSSLPEAEARAAIAQVNRQTNLPTDDVVRFGGARLWDAVVAGAATTTKRLRSSVGGSR